MPPRAGAGGHVTATEALACDVPALPVVTLALLLTVPHDATVVGEVTWTCLLALEAISPKLHVRMPVVIEQPVSLAPVSTDQLVPAVVGRVSDTVALVAVPAPLLVAVMTKPIG